MPNFGKSLMASEIANDLANRIRRCAELAGSGDELSRRSGVPRRTLESYLSGRSEPKATNLAAIANAVGASLDWLIVGKGPMVAGEAGPPAEAAPGIDEELMGRVVDGITKVYKEERVGLPAIDLGRLAAPMYTDLVNAGLATWDEKLAGLKVALERLRRDLRTAVPDKAKLSA